MSKDRGFPKTFRVRNGKEYEAVFRHRCTVSGEYFQVLAKPNNLAHPRLGIVIGRKIARRAVDRNYVKRVAREFFRLHRHELVGLDTVVRVRKVFGVQGVAFARQELARHYLAVKTRCLVYLSP